MKYFLDRANAAHAAMQDPHKAYSTWMTEYLNKKQKAALCHRAYPEPLRRDPGDEVQWKYQISCQYKSQKSNGEITIQKTVIGNHTCSCSCHKPLLHYPCSHVIVACLTTKNQHPVLLSHPARAPPFLPVGGSPAARGVGSPHSVDPVGFYLFHFTSFSLPSC
jgi:hypothetical protein